MDILKKYIKRLDIPNYHSIVVNDNYLKFIYDDLYLSGNTVYNRVNKITVIDIKKYNLDDFAVKKMINNFIISANIRNKTKPYIIKRLNEIDDIDYHNIWDFQYSDEGKKDRFLNEKGRCDY